MEVALTLAGGMRTNLGWVTISRLPHAHTGRDASTRAALLS